MIQIEFFEEDGLLDLYGKTNNFLRLNQKLKIIDIKYQAVYNANRERIEYSTMIMYEEIR